MTCGYCNGAISDGEVIAVMGRGKYHSVAKHATPELKSCLVASVMEEGNNGAFDNKVFYAGEFYSLDDVSRIAEDTEIGLTLSQSGVGHRAIGDLSVLKSTQRVWYTAAWKLLNTPISELFR